MKNKELFAEIINGLLYSWGGDTPPEAIWSANDLLDFYEKETGEKVPRFTEDGKTDAYLCDIISKKINPNYNIPKDVLIDPEFQKLNEEYK